MMTSEQVEAMTAMVADRTRLRQQVVKLRAACKATVALFEPRAELPDDIAKQFRIIVEKDPNLMQLRAALAETEEPT